LHDVGKIAVPAEILDKPATLSGEEWDLMRSHAAVGARILEPIAAYADVLPIVRHHHERYDGGGYPDGLAGEAIPLLARVLAVVDSFDAMTSRRPYREAMTVERAVAILRENAGTQFDGRVVGAFVALVERNGLDVDAGGDPEA
ncbi:MAG TPA: HD domain-containing phosphohydrolase, partial [Gemmatimonadota bacterium]|nr:HD domain-containing phosphohydrolase [Gemmatimonadota bacterium]